MVKNLPATQETQVWSLSWEDPLEKGIATHSSILYFAFPVYRQVLAEKAIAPHSSTLAWKIPWREELDRLQSMGSRRVGRDWSTLAAETDRFWGMGGSRKIKFESIYNDL